MRVLAVNSGSSSVKFKLVEGHRGTPSSAPDRGRVLGSGAVEDIGGTARLRLAWTGTAERTEERGIGTHREAVQWMLEALRSGGTEGGPASIDAVGHRVVHGGEAYRESVRIDETVLARLEILSELAPLHNPACLEGIRGAAAALGREIPQVAVFDTAFHRTMPDWAQHYAIDRNLAERHAVRRYGFHGIAHAAVAATFAAAVRRPLDRLRLITAHLGNGCSMTAIEGGRSIDTSMGFTPLEGLVMGTRSGDLDPAVVPYLMKKEQAPAEEVERWLNRRSGLLGLSGLTRDMRRLLAEADRNPAADLAVTLFCYRAKKYLGAYLAALGGADAVLFSGGIGEHAPVVRERICADMEWCGLRLDRARNGGVTAAPSGQAMAISEAGAALPAYVVHADEETWIVRETVTCLGRSQSK